MSSSQQNLLSLLDRSGAKLHALLTRLTLRQDVAEELMQELFVRLSEARVSIDNLDAYATRSAINLAFDWRRRQKNRPAPLPETYDPPSGEKTPPDKLVQTEEIEEVLCAIGQLKGSHQQALVMRYIQQDSYEDMAQKLDKTPHQVRGLCSRAMSQLRNVLGCNHSPNSAEEVTYGED